MIPRSRPNYTLSEFFAALSAPSDSRICFEAELAEHFGMRHALLFPYGRSAIHAFFQALGLAGQVVQPAYNCVVVAHATVCADCHPVFVDSQPDDPNQDPERMVDAVTEQTVAVIPTSTFGWSFDAQSLSERVRRRNPNALVLVDCCQAFDARYDGKLIVQAGDASVLAFGIGKPMTTLFGGALLTNRGDLAERIRCYRDQTYRMRGWTSNAGLWLYFLASWLALSAPFVGLVDRLEQNDTPLRRYLLRLRTREAIRLPANAETHLTSAQAAIGRTQLRCAQRMGERRRGIAATYRTKIQTSRFCREQWPDGSSYAIFATRLRQPERRAAFLESLRSQGVQGDTTLSYVVPALKCYQDRGFHGEEYPNALEWARRVVNFPVYPGLSDSDLRRCLHALDHAANEVLGDDR